MTDPRDHYSYALYADPAFAQSFHARRFGGPIGALVADQQARVLREALGRLEGRRVLDVGTGAGRAAMVLAEAGAVVTGVDASEEMLAIARARAAEANLDITFAAGDAHRLEAADRSVDVAVCLRVIMHTPRWRQCVGELCRVASQGVLLDFPSATSAALLQSIARRLAAACGVRTEPYRVFTYGQVEAELRARGFAVRHVDRQFVLPIAVHKWMNSVRTTIRVERALSRLGLRRWCGSPITVYAERV